MTMIELNAWCDTCGGCYQLHKSTTSSSASFDDQLALGPNTKTMMFESNTTYWPNTAIFQWNLAYILKYRALISIPWISEYSYSPEVESFFRGTFTLLVIYVCVCRPNIVTARGQWPVQWSLDWCFGPRSKTHLSMSMSPKMPTMSMSHVSHTLRQWQH